MLSDRGSAIPDELQQLNLLLTQIVFADEGATRWWPDRQPASAELPLAASADKKASGAEKKGWWSPDAKPPVKCNLQAILASEESTASVRRWVTVLETVAPMRTNTGAPIKAAVDMASCVTRDTEVKPPSSPPPPPRPRLPPPLTSTCTSTPTPTPSPTR